MTLVISVFNTFAREKTKEGCLEDIRASSTFGRVGPRSDDHSTMNPKRSRVVKTKNVFKKRIYISIKTQQLQEQRQDQNVDTQGTLNNEKGDTTYYNTSVREKEKKTNLRVIRAFKSTLEDLEERRSVHSLHSLHSMRSSRSHTGPRPLSDFTYIDEDPTTNTAYKSSNRSAEPMMSQDYETNYRGSSRTQQFLNSPASPLLLSVTGPANAYNHHYTTNTNTTITDNRSPTSNAHNQPLSPNHMAQMSSNNRDNTGNSLLLSSNNLVLPELTKLSISFFWNRVIFQMFANLMVSNNYPSLVCLPVWDWIGTKGDYFIIVLTPVTSPPSGKSPLLDTNRLFAEIDLK
ncbi:hypothetical protein EAG_07655 [Camponotus floridanus]|uniref:Uncharacterized protein n=1 Tax=Camponotus floridanus TaxID=104421 RepID=E2AND8_CAMFO|nr:hypothetical protein EAG_07655 [Camponotus floridanus]